ncbi:hypothetical protein ATN84_22295 [Paramesorhizobium deserti]|uniref:DUF4189 domain-containing protein n=2 Tax=Paramesorhizobium deserti TaxID=1494590 RepID=A0A135HP45_9HYPH|nr:hypothetical protein ATN84_22295 [Paramesorhizobium deserti]
MPINRYLWFVLIAIFVGLPIGNAADLVTSPPEPAGEEKGIWGAIAFSRADGRHGFFWGADKRKEAEDAALEHCGNAKGRACSVVKVFRNHRHWDDDDGTGFPYEHCAALSVGNVRAETPFWGAASATTRREAEQQAMSLCGGEGKQCKIREWVCT